MIDSAELAERYSAALRSYLAGGAETALQQAYEVGREALEAGVGPLVLFSIHRDVVQKLPPQPLQGEEFVSQVTTVFIEALAPSQMAAGTFDEVRTRVWELGTILQRHTEELEQMRRQLLEARRPRLSEARMLIERHAREIESTRAALETMMDGADSRRRLIADIVHAQEEERRRLAGDIHDDAVQGMTAVLLRIGLLGTRLTEPDQLRMVAELEGTIRDTIARLRRLIVGLSPPELDRAGLAAAIRSALDQFKTEFGVDNRLENRLALEPGRETRTIAYRIVQEALANARKHAQASVVDVTLETRDDGLYAVVKDDGVGFDVDAETARIRPGHLGLAAMRERAELAAGWFEIESGQGGTVVRFWIPDTPRDRSSRE